MADREEEVVPAPDLNPERDQRPNQEPNLGPDYLQNLVQILTRIPDSIKLLAAIVTVITFVIIFLPPHLNLEVKPSYSEINPGEEIQATIIITKSGGIPGFWEYQGPVSLSTVNLDNEISVLFTPFTGTPTPAFVSTALIQVRSNATKSAHLITIVGLGENQQKSTAGFNIQVGRHESPTAPSLSTQNGTKLSGNTFDLSNYYYPSGWMGDVHDIQYNPASTNVTPHTGQTSIEIRYSAQKSDGMGWSGIYWQYPDNNWGDRPSGYNLSGYSTLRFWARGGKGGEQAEFKTGGITGQYPDSLQPPSSTGPVVLSSEWKQYTIDLRGKDLNRIAGGFVWVSPQDRNPQGCTIYLDDIQFGK